MCNLEEIILEEWLKEFWEKLNKIILRFVKDALEQIPNETKEKFLKDSKKHSAVILTLIAYKGRGGIIENIP